MKRKLISQILYPLLLVLLVLFSTTTHSHEKSDTGRNKSIFAELAGSSLAIISANFDMRFNKGRSDGLGMRIGIGMGSFSTSDYLLETSESKSKIFSVPVEVNYIIGENRWAFEMGLAITYASITEDYHSEFLGIVTDTHETGNLVASYLPVGIRLKPVQKNGFMMKLNIGPVFNFSAPNMWSEETVNIWGGLALGYSFY